MTHYFLSAPEHSDFAEAHVKRRTRKRAIRLFDNDDINGSSQGGRVDLVVHVPEITDEFSQIIHPSSGRTTVKTTTADTKTKNKKQKAVNNKSLLVHHGSTKHERFGRGLARAASGTHLKL